MKARHAVVFVPIAAALLLQGCTALRQFAASKAPEQTQYASTAPDAGLAASADSVRAPAWRVGSMWQYSDGYGLRVERVTGSTTTFRRTDDATQWLSRRGFLREDSQSSTAVRKLVFEDLPPEAGTKLTAAAPLTYRREYTSGGDMKKHVTSWTVERRERIRVPAGEFDCVVLVMRTRSQTDDWTGYERWWFSPQAQNYVRMEYKYGPTSGSRVLTSYKLAG